MANIPLFKVISNTDLILEKLRPVFESGYIGQGPKVEEFEDALERLWGLTDRTVLAVNSCTSSLELALELCGVRDGAEVVTTPIGCSASVAAILARNGRPIWCDVDPLSGLAVVKDVASKITSRTKAILVVDWAGAPCDYDELAKLGVPVIEDAAHGFMTTYKGKHVAAGPADYVAFSFQAIKHLNTVDGGALRPPSDKYKEAQLLRWFGLDRESSASFRCSQNIRRSGFKWQPTDVGATIGLANLDLAVAAAKDSQVNSFEYCRTIKETPNVYQAPFNPDSSYWLHSLLVENRAGFMEYMREQGIDTSPVHNRIDKHDCYEFPNGPLFGVDFFNERQVAIPNGRWLTYGDREKIANAVNNWRG